MIQNHLIQLLDSPQGVTVSVGVAVAGGHDQEHGALPHVQG